MGSAATPSDTALADLESVTNIDELTERCDFSGIFQEIHSCHPSKTEFNAIRFITGTSYAKLKSFCNQNSIDLSTLLQFAWHNVLKIYGNGSQTHVATQNGTSKILPVILNHPSIQQKGSTTIMQGMAQSFMLNSVNSITAPVNSTRFDSMFVNAEDSVTSSIFTEFMLTLIVRESIGSLLSLNLIYRGQLVDPKIQSDFLSVMTSFIEEIVVKPNEPISSLERLPKNQLQLIEEWNTTDGAFPSAKRLHHLFEEAAERTPEKIAVVYKDVQLTYRELNARANQLAFHIRNSVGAKPEQFIALLLDKTEITIIVCLGIWKSGAAYVPIDPTYPDERVKFMLEDSKAQLAITNEHHAQRLRRLAEHAQDGIITIEPLLIELKDSDQTENLELGLTSSQLAYVTYTSGTTGVPKGVFKEHKGVVNSITDLSAKYGMITDEPEAVVLFAAYVFEPFVRQSLMALINSHKLVIVNDDEKLDQEKFPEFLQKHNVTYLNGTASVLQEYDLTNCTSLSKLILVGEEFTESRYRKLRETYKRRIITEYGFTESALVTAMKIFDPETQRTDRTIGKPLRNVKCYVLDQNLKQVPIHAIGELYIGGMGISRGYLNRPELTNERFLPNPFQTEAEKSTGINSKMYRTGDLARWLPSGQVEYIGRNDFQIKLRGIRIEPGEIEALALQYPSIAKCVVLVRNSKADEESKHLIGFYVCANGKQVLESELISHLEAKLPRYMIPSRMVQVPTIPVNINGKVDHRALPEIPIAADKVMLPRNDLDAHLCRIWSSILGIPLQNTGIHDDFFRLGGHSITCIQLIARIRQELQLKVTLDMIFGLRTIENLSDCLKNQQKEEINLSNVKQSSSFAANSLQQGLIYHHLKQGSIDDAYIMQSIYEYNSEICINKMRTAWEYAQQKYPSLRLKFHWEKYGLQVVKAEQTLDWRYLEKSEEFSMQELVERDRAEGYSLETGSLFRIYLFKEDISKYSLLFSCHHIILDGWSLPILFQFVHSTYVGLIQNKPVEIKLQVDKAYLEAQDYLQAHREDHTDYWTKEIEQIGMRSDLSGLLNDKSRYAVQLTNYDRIEENKEKKLSISDEITNNLKLVMIKHGITLHSILQFVWHKVLSVYGNGTHSVVGTTVSGRNLPIDNIEISVGLFINTLPLIVDHERQDTRTVLEAIRDIQLKVTEMNTKSNVELGSLKNGELKHGLFDCIFVLENYPNLDSTEADAHKERLGFKHKFDVEKLDYPLAVIAREGEYLEFTICYAGELIEDSQIEALLSLVNELLQQVPIKLSQPVKELNLVPMETLQLLDEWNQTKADFPMHKTLHQIFEECVERNPDKSAVVFDEVRLTYAQLNQEANRLAHYLRSKIQIKPDNFVALLMDKNHFMIVSILAVWKSGGAYVPIDPSYPAERIQFMLQDTEAKVVITNKLKYVQGIDVANVNVILIPELIQTNSFKSFQSSNPVPISTSTDLAYVIYTSGTTGKPKGVMIEHRGVVNLQQSLATTFGLQETNDEVLLSFSNYVFDHFVEQMTDAVLNGQTLIVLNDEMRADKERLYRCIKQNRVTYLSGTPSVLSLYEFTGLDSLRRIDAVGEDFSETLFKKIRATFSGLIINGYGPTEVSITSHKRLYPNPSERRLNKSIGYQMKNISSYVLNKHLKRVPVGAIGELYLGGICVGRGYLNRLDLTSKQFLPNPFGHGRIYKTGDLARFLTNGELECLGRNDFQVKVRGLRIELSEIEAVMAGYPDVTHSVVVARESTKGILIGYYVAAKPVSESEIKKWIQSKLPQYMIPNRLVQIPEIPVTINGKVDTRALSGIEIPKVANQNTNLNSPLSEVELKMVTIWAELLDVPQDLIGTQDDFFGLGGDSLLATTLSFMLTKAFGKSVSVARVFKLKSIEALSKYVYDLAENVTKIQPVDGNQQVSMAQERLLFIDELENGTNAFNIQFTLMFVESVNKDRLKMAIESTIRRHEALRTLFQDRMQVVLSEEDALEKFKLDFKVVRDSIELEEEVSMLSKFIFDLEQELPIRVEFYQEPNMPHFYASFLFHHVCFDGWSWLVFQRDLKAFDDSQNGKSIDLPVIDISYKDFSSWQVQHLQGKRLKSLIDYWLTKMKGYEPLNLITDFSRPRKFNYSGREIKFELSTDVTNALKSLAKTLKVSLYTILVSAYCLMLRTYTNQREIVIGTPVSNRSRPELENLIGFFVNMLPLRIHIDPGTTLETYVQSVSEEIMKSQIHQELPFDKLVAEMRIETDLSRHPVFQVIFTLDQFSATYPEYQSFSPINAPETTVKYDSSVSMTETPNGLTGTFTYATKLFCSDTINRFMNTFKHILVQISASAINLEFKVRDINPTEDLQNASTMSGPESVNIWSEGRTLHEIFQTASNRSPNAVALVCENVELTYDELNERSNQLAHYLHRISDNPIQPDHLIALLLEKSDLMIISILGVWKADSAYVPIDPSFPDERINFILKDTGTKTVITNQKYASRLAKIHKNINILAIDDPISATEINSQPKLNLPTNSNENSLCYIIYTSGTTGRPKGVMIEHGGLVNFRHGLKSLYPESDQGILLLSNYVFDFSIEQIILSIFNGNKLIIPSNEISLDDGFYEDMNRHGLTYLSGTPTFIQQMDLSKFKHLRRVTVAGEFFTKSHYDRIRNGFSGPIANAYGVTETSVYNTIQFFEKEDPYKNTLGNVLPNMQGYVLNDELQMLPNGAVGKLYLAGNCVARGYLNLPELTANHFISTSFHERMYNTGDLVRCLPDGTLEYLGRSDTQVKIRGLRVDLGEIEVVLGSHPRVAQCTVMATEDQQLIGYYARSGRVTEEELLKYLGTKLPSYIIPNRLIEIEGNLRTTVNGKLDTKALEQEYLKKKEQRSQSLPRNETELQVIQIWEEFLRIVNIGIDDDFFRLGGDSIMSMQVARRIRTHLKMCVNVKDIFVYRTVRRLYDHVVLNGEPLVEAVVKNIPEVSRPDIPLTPIQKWFFDKNLPNRNHWNQTFTLKTPQLEVNKIKETMKVLVNHHDAFRLRFRKNGENVTQFYTTSNPEIIVHALDVSTLQNGVKLEHWLTKYQSCFDLENRSTFCLVYLHGFEDGSSTLWFAIHHLIVDSVSWRIIKQDFETVYKSGKLGRRGSSYQDWARALQNYKCTATEKAHWNDIVNETELFNRNLQNAIENCHQSHSTFTLSTRETKSLLREGVQANDCGINELLLSALGNALECLTKDSVNYVTLEGHGREEFESSLDISNTVGWFTAMYPIKLNSSPNSYTSIRNIEHELRKAPFNGIGYGIEFGFNKDQLPRITFNYLGQFDGSDESEWSFTNMSGEYTMDRAPGDENHSLLDVTGVCFNGQLRFNVESKFGQTETQEFMTVFKEALLGFANNNGSSISHELKFEEHFEPYFEFNQNEDSSKILFVLPPGEGGAESYFNNIVGHLPECRLILFNNYYLDNKNILSTFEDLAVFYLKFIKRIQPSGPYNFLGWSFGGVLSLEIARQLVLSGEEIQNLFFIDSYFNVKKACEEIGRAKEANIIDKINYTYTPNIKEIQRLVSSTKNVVLFKAGLMNDMYNSDNQYLLYEYYMNSKFNNLDSLVPIDSEIQMYDLPKESHTSWVKNSELVRKICSFVHSKM